MSDPVRRCPEEFFRVLKKMCRSSHWQKAMFFASRGRMVGFNLELKHYNLCLYSQAVWGRAMEIVQVIDAMNHDNVQMDMQSYYYIVNGMANVDHGYSADFNVNNRLKRLQHWRVAISALMACRANGFDPTATMYNSAIVACTIPTMEYWHEATCLLHEMLDEGHKPQPVAVRMLDKCLLRNERIQESLELIRQAVRHKTEGYTKMPPRVEPGPAVPLTALAEGMYNAQRGAVKPSTGGVPEDAQGVFRPMVWRGYWWRWHEVANKYRPRDALRPRQLAPRFSPTGIPGWKKM
ncbi:hypothetical protein XU18_3111 [Perkinsela sp. CCAP 1560/4]|nr:hypothetical protein XU18_3111 [Perkinsela sp. CCAP 1560/4]|eukprot:KNH05949.1 hypothetical protein XU18_3111 [Perkinsela sp. CCAP 1560/4]